MRSKIESRLAIPCGTIPYRGLSSHKRCEVIEQSRRITRPEIGITSCHPGKVIVERLTHLLLQLKPTEMQKANGFQTAIGVSSLEIHLVEKVSRQARTIFQPADAVEVLASARSPAILIAT